MGKFAETSQPCCQVNAPATYGEPTMILDHFQRFPHGLSPLHPIQLDIGFSERFRHSMHCFMRISAIRAATTLGVHDFEDARKYYIDILWVIYIYIIYPSLFLLKFPLLMVEPPLKPTIPVVFNIIECPHYYSKSNPPVLLFKPKCCLLVGYPIGTGP